ncbi:MAG: hypothetical protein P1U83_13495 [Roseovarius sp.]|nr:hypothetical protein [Roseovarius sp.]
MRYLFLIILPLVLSFARMGCADGAFGLEFGQAIPETANEKSDGFYYLKPPKTHPEFETYVISGSDSFGVCRISAIGKDHNDDEWGLSIKAKYEEIIKALEKKYGVGEREEFLRPGALYDDPEDFSRAISKNQRIHQIYWENVSDGPTGLNDLFLTVKADWEDTYIIIQYRSNSYNDCKIEYMEKANDAF